VTHPLLGPVLLEGPRFVLSRTPGHVRAAGPVYGQHIDEVRALLGERPPEHEMADSGRQTTGD
jgi:crotonobetainyl-CoA:carnitine CoA-transferase CaiB-like acyl-CoA transferase